MAQQELGMLKICSKCNESKDISFFRQCKYPSGKLYLKSCCRSCESKNNSISNKPKTLEQKKKFLEYKKQWRESRKDIENSKYRDRIKNDLMFRLRKNISRTINHALHRRFSNKNDSFLKYLDYSINDLIIHLERLFDSNMNWSNYGVFWHIDHIIPQSDLPYASMDDENFKICWSLNNLRPLNAAQNMKDGATRIRHNKK